VDTSGKVVFARIGEELEKLTARARAGGFTYDAVHHGAPTTGFVVSTYPHFEMVIKPEDMTEDNILDVVSTYPHFETVIKFLDRVADTFSADPQAMIGGWSDTATDKIILDVVRVVDSEEEGRRLAQEHNQAGIYDLGGGKYIETVAAAHERFRRLKDRVFLGVIRRLPGGDIAAPMSVTQFLGDRR
jgi:hypothetical protein